MGAADCDDGRARQIECEWRKAGVTRRGIGRERITVLAWSIGSVQREDKKCETEGGEMEQLHSRATDLEGMEWGERNLVCNRSVQSQRRTYCSRSG
jgi:hypothetical protein